MSGPEEQYDPLDEALLHIEKQDRSIARLTADLATAKAEIERLKTRTDDDGLPLRVWTEDGAIHAHIGTEILAFAARNLPGFWGGKSGPDEPVVNVTDATAFAKEVVREMNREEEDGSNLFNRMLDAAIKRAVENGCEGVDHE